MNGAILGVQLVCWRVGWMDGLATINSSIGRCVCLMGKCHLDSSLAMWGSQEPVLTWIAVESACGHSQHRLGDQQVAGVPASVGKQSLALLSQCHSEPGRVF